jgi:hypothetical protein
MLKPRAVTPIQKWRVLHTYCLRRFNKSRFAARCRIVDCLLMFGFSTYVHYTLD